MQRLSGKVALITGGARGMGRAHAVRMAEEGARIIVCDIAEQIASVPYPMARRSDLDTTAGLVEQAGQRCVVVTADARDAEAMDRVVARAVEEFGRLDIAVVNHGLGSFAGWDAPLESIDDLIDVNIRGVFHATRSAARQLVAQGEGGSLILTASVAGLRPFYGLPAYTMTKHAVIGLMRGLSADLAAHRIRVNALCPGSVDTPMMINDVMLSLFSGLETGGTRETADFACRNLNLMPEAFTREIDVANTAVFLASDEARAITGIAMAVDNGMANQPAGIPPLAATALAAAERGSAS
ncbi:mycofactocin-coupled SDR family oxidoreductase [Mycobacterium syngnathidarum]